MQQAQVNLFADMGAQPTTLDDRPDGRHEVDRHRRSDRHHHHAGGGCGAEQRHAAPSPARRPTPAARVAGVEVSTDGGATWQRRHRHHLLDRHLRAEGASATRRIRVRAIDDSANIGTVRDPQRLGDQCPCSIFGNEMPPTPAPTTTAPSSSACGFTPAVDGFVDRRAVLQGRRQHRHARRVALESRRCSAWPRSPSPTRPPPDGRPRTFGEAVPVAAGTRPTSVSYTAPQGHYASESWAFVYRGLDTGATAGRRRLGSPAGRRVRRDRDHARPELPVAPTTSSTCPSRRPTTPPLIAHQPVRRCRLVERHPGHDDGLGATYSKPHGAGHARPDAEGRQRRHRRRHAVVRRDHAHHHLHAERAAGGVRPATPRRSPARTRWATRSTSGGTWSFTTAKPPNPPGVCPCIAVQRRDHARRSWRSTTGCR